jgi:hypothetical protein
MEQWQSLNSNRFYNYKTIWEHHQEVKLMSNSYSLVIKKKKWCQQMHLIREMDHHTRMTIQILTSRKLCNSERKMKKRKNYISRWHKSVDRGLKKYRRGHDKMNWVKSQLNSYSITLGSKNWLRKEWHLIKLQNSILTVKFLKQSSQTKCLKS